MDSDRIEGKGQDLLGRGKEALGDLTGNQDMQTEGQSDQVKGTVQEKFGEAKDKVRDVVEDIKR